MAKHRESAAFQPLLAKFMQAYNASEANIQATSYAGPDLDIQFGGACNHDTSLSLVLIPACGTEHVLIELTH